MFLEKGQVVEVCLIKTASYIACLVHKVTESHNLAFLDPGVLIFVDSLMGSLNCVQMKCSLGFTADRSGDQLLDLKVTHTAAGGVSRTDAQLVAMVERLHYSVALASVHSLNFHFIL